MRRNSHGFTLVELLVSIAIVGILVTLLLPAVQSSRAASRRMTCQNNLRQLALAAHQYHVTHNTFPSGLKQKRVQWAPRYRGTSLFALLLPHLEKGNILRNWDYDSPLKNTTGGSAALSAAVVSSFLCPSDTLLQNPIVVADRYYGMTSYGGNGGTRSYDPFRATLDGIFYTTGPASEPKPNQRPVKLAMISDGTSQTILFGERSHSDPNLETFAEVYWAESLKHLGRWAAIGGRKRIGDVTMSGLIPINYKTQFDYANHQLANPPLANRLDFEEYEERRKCAFGSSHIGGANFALADGSARFIEGSLSQSILTTLCTRNGGDEVGE